MEEKSEESIPMMKNESKENLVDVKGKLFLCMKQSIKRFLDVNKLFMII